MASSPKVADIPADRLAALNAGTAESRHLTECLAVDFAALAVAAFPELSPAARDAAAALRPLGISRRMSETAALLLGELGASAFDRAAGHRSDTLRGWACFMAATLSPAGAEAQAAAIRPFADDGHFGVREWAWMAVRPRFAADLPAAIAVLSAWTADTSDNVRRFACEVLRPRGVWCSHLRALRDDPAPALPVLEALRADPARYVQNSVANWLNDAAKDHPDWVRELCGRWERESPGAETRYIVKRAKRSL